MSTTQAFSDWAVETDFKSLPPAVVNAARRLIEESVAVSILGGGMRLGRRIGTSKGIGDMAYATGAVGDTTSLARAAFVNAAWADCNDSAGGSYTAPLHPAKNLVPATLAVALTEGASGADVIRAVSLGTEFAFRLDASIGLEHMARGHYSDGPIGALASAVAVGALTRLDRQALAHAIDLAVLLAPATVGGQNMWVASGRPLALGRAAATGIEAARAAAGGIAGPVDAVACAGGFASALAGHADVNSILAELGDSWHCVRHYLKPFVGCKLTHPAREGLQILKREEGLQAEQVSRIVVHHPLYDLPVIRHQPRGGENEVAYSCSSPYLMACSLLYDELGPEVFASKRMSDVAAHELSQRISVVEDPELTALYAQGMSARGASGTPIRMVVERVGAPPLTYVTNRVKGDPFEGWEVTDPELDHKFQRYVDGRLSPKQAEAALAMFRDLGAVDDVRLLADLLR